jgi:hypothetical protein
VVNANYEPMPFFQTDKQFPRHFRFFILFFFFCMVLELSRGRYWALRPSLNPGAEDGGYIYGDALQYPFWQTWFAPIGQGASSPVGYLLLLQRMVGSFAAIFPPASGPFALYLGTYTLHILAAMYIISDRFSVYIESVYVRAAIALYIALLPTLEPYNGSVTGSLQYLFVIPIALIAAAPKSRMIGTTMADVSILAILGLSCPSIVILAPLFLLRFIWDRDRHSVALLITVVIVSTVHLVFVTLSGRPAESDLHRLIDAGPLELMRAYFDITIVHVFLNAFLVRATEIFPAGVDLSWTLFWVGCAFATIVVLLSVRLQPRLRWTLLYLAFVPHLAAIFFYATKNGMSLEQLIKMTGGGERYFYSGIAAVGMITIANVGLQNIAGMIAIILSGFLFNAAAHDYASQTSIESAYFDWRRQAPCLSGLRDGTRGTCWVTFAGAPPHGWKRIVIASIDIEKLTALGITDLVDYKMIFDPPTRTFVAFGWAADPNGPTYPAAVFADIDGIQNVRQLAPTNDLVIWEQLGGRARNDDMHSLGFTIKFPEDDISKILDAGKSVTVKLKIASFDLTGYYLAPYAYRINPNRTISKVAQQLGNSAYGKETFIATAARGAR